MTNQISFFRSGRRGIVFQPFVQRASEDAKPRHVYAGVSFQKKLMPDLTPYCQVTFRSGHNTLPGLSGVGVVVQEIRLFPWQKSLQFRAEA